MIRGIIQSVIEGVIKRFSATGRPGETIADREYFQHYGFSSRPHAGAEIIIIRDGNHIIGIASDDRRYRITLEEGEAALYDDLGQKVHLTRTGIEAVSPIKATVTAPEVDIVAEMKVTMTTPLVEISGALAVGANITAGGHIIDSVRSMAEDRVRYNNHTHPGGGYPDEQM